METFLFSWLLLVISCFKEPALPNNLKNLPGPLGLPIVGYIPFLGKLPYVTFTELSKKFGPIFQLRIGQRTVVVLNDLSMIQKAFMQNGALVGRPSVPSLQVFVNSGPNKFIDRTGDAAWKFSRKIAIKALAMFASSKNNRLEQLVHSASDSMTQDFTKTEESPIDPHETLFETLCAIIGSMIFGGQFDPKDPWLKKVMTVFQESGIDFYNLKSFLDYLPLGSYVFHVLTIYDDLIKRYIDGHKCNEQVTDLADALNKVAEEATDEELESLVMSREGIRYISDDLFAAGFITTVDTLRWALNLLAANQQVQKQLHLELDHVLQGQRPTLEQRSNLPFTEAVLLEVLRFSSLAPLHLFHEAMEDTEVEGYHIPKGAIVVPNAWGVHRDETIFINADSFDPERFLIANGTKINSDMSQVIIPFGTGKRRCVGENLARQELFLVLAAIFQKFQISPAQGEIMDMSADPSVSSFRMTRHYKLVFTPRF